MPIPKPAQPATNHGNAPSPTPSVARPSTTTTTPSTSVRPSRSAARPTGRSATRSTNCPSIRRPDTPPRSSANSRVPLSGTRNWLTEDQARARMMPTRNIVHTSGVIGSALTAPGSPAGPPFAARAASGKRRRRPGASTSPTMRGEDAMARERLQPRPAGKRPTSPRPPSTPIIAENSNTLSRIDAPAPRSSRRIAVSPPMVPRVWARPSRRRPSTSAGNEDATASRSTPPASSTGAAASVVPRRWPASQPVGSALAIRAKPNAPATTPSCQSARAAVRAISGRSGLKAPMPKHVTSDIRQSSVVPLNTTSGRAASSRSRPLPTEQPRAAQDVNGRVVPQG